MNLLVMSYTRDVPPFIRNVISVVEGYFDQVIYLTAEVRNDDVAECHFSKTEIIEVPTNHFHPRSLISCIRTIVTKRGRISIARAVREKRADIKFLKYLATKEACSEILFQAAKPILSSWEEAETVVLSEWFDSESLAAAKLKEVFPKIKAYSLAHSYEVNPDRCPYVDISFTEYVYDHIDHVYFISAKVLQLYKAAVMEKTGVGLDKSSVCYLGSLGDGYVGEEKVSSTTLSLVSCSNMYPLKRLSLICDAINLWNDCNVEWTHFGAGECFPDIEKRADAIRCQEKRINLPGRVSNEDILQSYEEHSYDLFVNVSSIEGVPISIMEAMSKGIPVIATSVGGNPEIVIDGFNGFLLSDNPDGREIVETLQKFYQMNHEERSLMRSNARSFWEEKFDARKNSLRFVGLE